MPFSELWWWWWWGNSATQEAQMPHGDVHLSPVCFYDPSTTDGTGQAAAGMLVLVTADLELCKIINC